jgi:kynureninase
LTAIAGLLALNAMARFTAPVVQAQSEQYVVADVKTRNTIQSLQTEINKAAQGRQLIALLPYDQAGHYIAVYK